MSRTAVVLALLNILVGCDPAPAGNDPGAETGPCVDGGCFDGLECLSDLCVAGDGTGGETTSNSGPGGSGPDDSGNDAGPDDSGSDSDTGNDTADPDTGGDDDTSDGSDSSGDSSDTTGVGDACDVWAQDCPAGSKCAPWADDGGDSWTAAHCVELAASPLGVGDPCVAQGSSASGEDDCGAGLMCWGADPATAGTCVELCTGGAASPQCDDPFLCSMYFDGALPLCIASCDPVAQNCPLDLVCYSYAGELECAPDGSGSGGAFGEECAMSGQCDPGLGCMLASDLSSTCDGFACCTPFCELGSDTCPRGTTCQSTFEGEVPPGFEIAGWCLESDPHSTGLLGSALHSDHDPS